MQMPAKAGQTSQPMPCRVQTTLHSCLVRRNELLGQLKSPLAAWRQEQAKLLWAEGRQQMALQLLTSLCQQAGQACQTAEQRARVLTLCGQWMADARQASWHPPSADTVQLLGTGRLQHL